MTQTIEERIRVLEDIEEIKKLKASYCLYLDAGIAGDAKKWDDYLDLFTEDVIGDLGIFGFYKGKEAVAKFFKETVGSILTYTVHEVHNPIIQVEGDKAHGTWYYDTPCTVKQPDGTEKAAWMHGMYFEDYIRIGGKWKYKEWKVTFEFFTPFEEGWVKTKILNM
jgi:ketosteroid isomerase-like protein